MQSFDQPNMFPETDGSVPPNVDHIWAAHDRHFATHGSRPDLTYERVVTLLEMAGVSSSKSTIERARREYPHLFPPHWPLRREDKRPWLDEPSLLLLPRRLPQKQSIAQNSSTPPELQQHVLIATMFDTRTSRLVEIECTMDPTTGRLSPWVARLYVLAMASLSTAAMLDLSDGRIDGMVRWCRVLAGLAGLHG